jgi:hypothetical protein
MCYDAVTKCTGMKIFIDLRTRSLLAFSMALRLPRSGLQNRKLDW